MALTRAAGLLMSILCGCSDVTSDKAYSVEQRLNALSPGPWTAFNPLAVGWSVLAPYTGAWARYEPLTNTVRISASMATDGTHASDAYQIGVMPAQDKAVDQDGNPAPNSLLPQQVMIVDCTTDVFQTGATPRSPTLHIQANGTILIYGVASASRRLDCCDSYSLDQM